MSEPLALDIELLAELFKAGGWRELRVQAGGLSLLFSNDLDAVGLSQDPRSVRAELVGALPPFLPSERKNSPSTGSGRPEEAGSPDPSWRAVPAPNLGTFYRSPKPGAAPFVEIGQHVTPDTEICLLEVMKLFTSVKAGIAGTVRRVDATDGALVEGGQVLFHIEPA